MDASGGKELGKMEKERGTAGVKERINRRAITMRKPCFSVQSDEPRPKKAPSNSQKKMEVLGAFRVRSNLTAESLQQKLKSVAYKFTVWVIVTGPMPSKKALSETSTEEPAPEGTPPEYP